MIRKYRYLSIGGISGVMLVCAERHARARALTGNAALMNGLLGETLR